MRAWEGRGPPRLRTLSPGAPTRRRPHEDLSVGLHSHQHSEQERSSPGSPVTAGLGSLLTMQGQLSD